MSTPIRSTSFKIPPVPPLINGCPLRPVPIVYVLLEHPDEQDDYFNEAHRKVLQQMRIESHENEPKVKEERVEYVWMDPNDYRLQIRRDLLRPNWTVINFTTDDAKVGSSAISPIPLDHVLRLLYSSDRPVDICPSI